MRPHGLPSWAKPAVIATDTRSRPVPFADVVAGGANALGERVSDLVETAGTFGRNLLDAAGFGVARLPGIGPGLRWLVHWLATVVSAAADLVATLVKVVVELVAAVAVGLLRVVGGVVGLVRPRSGRRSFVQGLGEVGSSLAGPVLVGLGKAVALVQAVLLTQRGERPLTADEHARLHQVFRGSVALYNVRVVDGFAGLFSLNPRPFTLGNTIYMKHREPERYARTLVHECAHVWQNQNVGTRYAIQALWGQYTVPHAYHWDEELAHGRAGWEDFNREAQAELLMNVWQHGRRDRDTSDGAFYADDPVGDDVGFAWDGVDHTALARDAIGSVRAVRSRRYSRRLRGH
jgi:hypothetical protein